jgi:hypothetical protein
MRSRARYSQRVAAPKPPAIEERSWEIFTAYWHKQRTFEEIGAEFHLSSNQARRIVDEVGAQLGSVHQNGARTIALESPIESLGLSVRTCNALHAVGCNTVGEALRLDLSRTVRGLGRKTKGELVARLERAGFSHPSIEARPASEIRTLEKSLERMQSRIDKALGAVAKEIGLVRQRLRKNADGRPATSRGDDYSREES